MSIQLGIIGTGLAARGLHWPALQRCGDKFEIVALANRTHAKAEAFAELIGSGPRITTDYHELLSWSDVQAVVVAVPIVLNAAVTIDALRAGKHVLLEKPIAGSVAEGRRVVDEAKQHQDLVLLVAENIRYEPRFRQASELLERGAIGRVVMLHHDVLSPITDDNPYAETAWRKRPEHLGGYLSDGGVHEIAALHVLAGRIAVVEGLLTSFHPDVDPTDTFLANLRFVSGAIGHLTYSVGVQREEDLPLKVYGTLGSLGVYGDRITLSTVEGEEEIAIPALPNGFDLEFLDFYRSITDGKTVDVNPQDALDDLEVVHAVLRSAREGRSVCPG